MICLILLLAFCPFLPISWLFFLCDMLFPEILFLIWEFPEDSCPLMLFVLLYFGVMTDSLPFWDLLLIVALLLMENDCILLELGAFSRIFPDFFDLFESIPTFYFSLT